MSLIISHTAEQNPRLSARGAATTEGRGSLVRTRVLATEFSYPTLTIRSSVRRANHIIWTGERFLASSFYTSAMMQTSVDGITWSDTPDPATPDYPVLINCGSGRIVVRSQTSPWCKYSTNHGLTWNSSTGVAVMGMSPSHYAANALDVVGIKPFSNTYQYSSDGGASWTSGVLPGTLGSMPQLLYTGNMFVVYENGSTSIYWSPTGAPGTWSTATTSVFAGQYGGILPGRNIVWSSHYMLSGLIAQIDTSSGVPVLTNIGYPPPLGVSVGCYRLSNGVWMNLLEGGASFQLFSEWDMRAYKEARSFPYNFGGDNGTVAIFNDVTNIYSTPLPVRSPNRTITE